MSGCYHIWAIFCRSSKFRTHATSCCLLGVMALSVKIGYFVHQKLFRDCSTSEAGAGWKGAVRDEADSGFKEEARTDMFPPASSGVHSPRHLAVVRAFVEPNPNIAEASREATASATTAVAWGATGGRRHRRLRVDADQVVSRKVRLGARLASSQSSCARARRGHQHANARPRRAREDAPPWL